MKIHSLAWMLAAIALASCDSSQPENEAVTAAEEKTDLRPEDFEAELHGDSIHLYQLENANGLRAAITNYGARLVSLRVPDKEGKMEDVVQGFPNIEGYLNAREPYHGATIGRYANRIANGKFSLRGKTYELARNDGQNHLHGGPGGFHSVVWEVLRADSRKVELRYRSEDGEGGYPGTAYVTVTYQLTDDNMLRIAYKASVDQETPLNLTHHSYFNLSGNLSSSIEDHLLMIDASQFTPVNEQLIPTGEIASLEGSPLDFRAPKAIGRDIDASHPQLQYANGFDHNFVLDRNHTKPGRALAARVTEPNSGRVMEVWTNEPGLQFYSGNFLDGTDTGKYGERYGRRSAFCLETQHYPDSPNQLKFPSVIAQPGRMYTSVCEYHFKIAEEKKTEGS